ncbi:protein-arginine omega-N methyltransferase [Starmerella bacillaris]|uniref:type I protein arginine methyltransferase n=1 Tax=Starmerella bacillaris TaxID=1247836 RepID=A0AAV5RL15_STABA|nr:protein-arginine omega-N methyltransferase [Starmerella bacillaris]
MSENLDYSDQHYFNSYDHFSIHEEMLKDSVRTISYRDAIYKNRDQFKDKVVLDVGCGSGILSMFAANAGAKHVIGVDRSNIIDMAREVVAANGLSSKITLIKGKMEEVVLPFDKVDIIVSEWMGYFLLYEAMLDTVLYARDRYLVDGGLILPDKAIMYISGIEDEEYKGQKIGFWDDVYGFDYTPFKSLALRDPLVDCVEEKSVITTKFALRTFDLYTVTKKDLSFSSDFQLLCMNTDTLHGFVVWFDIDFERVNNKVHFSTGPAAKYTHWKQTVFYTVDNHNITTGDSIQGKIDVSPNVVNPRDVDIEIDYSVQNGSRHCLKFIMA